MFREPLHAWITHKASFLKGEGKKRTEGDKISWNSFLSELLSSNPAFYRNGRKEINEQRSAKYRKQRHNRLRWKSSPSNPSMLDHVEKPSRPRWMLAKTVSGLQTIIGARFVEIGQKYLVGLIGVFHRTHCTSSHLGRDRFAHFVSSLCASSGIELQFAACLFSPAGLNSWNPIVNEKYPRGKMFTSGEVHNCRNIFQPYLKIDSFAIKVS